MRDTALELYNKLLETSYDKYYYLSHEYKPKKLFIKEYDYNMWLKDEEESNDKEKSTDK